MAQSTSRHRQKNRISSGSRHHRASTIKPQPEAKEIAVDLQPATKKAGSSKDQKVCDFYNNPTILSRLILQQKYGLAIKRLEAHPEEAMIWVGRARRTLPDEKIEEGRTVQKLRKNKTPAVFNPHKLDDGTTIVSKQLPLHMCCHNLALYNSALLLPLKKDLNKLVKRLIDVYPVSCKFADFQGSFPLHLCIRHGASTKVVSMALTAAASVVSLSDCEGVTPAEWNQLCTTDHCRRDRINQLLQRGPAFWKVVRSNAKEHRAQAKTQELKKASKEEASDDETVWSEMSAAFGVEEETDSESKISPIAWSQLEQRCDVLEQLHAEALIQNRDLQRALAKKQRGNDDTDEDSLATPPRRLREQVSDELEKGLQDENRRLWAKIDQLKGQNQNYKDKIASLEENIRDLLWASGKNIGDSHYNKDTVYDHQDQVNGSFLDPSGVSSLTLSGVSGFFSQSAFLPPQFSTQPAGMFGDNSQSRGGSPVRVRSPVEGMMTSKSSSPNSVDLLGGIGSPSKQQGVLDSSNIDFFFTDDVFDEQFTEAKDDSNGTYQSTFTGLYETSYSNHHDDRPVLVLDDDSYEDDDLDSLLAGAQKLAEQNGAKLSSQFVHTWNKIKVEDDEYYDDQSSAHGLSRISEKEELEETSSCNDYDDFPVAESTWSTPYRSGKIHEITVTPIDDAEPFHRITL